MVRMDFSALTDRFKRFLHPLRPLWSAVQLWLDADGLRMSAAMSFYGMLSLAPLLLLVVGVLGWWLDRSYVELTLIDQVRAVVGDKVAEVMQGALASAKNSSEGRLASIMALITLVSGATGVFVELQNALEKIWMVGEEPDSHAKAAWLGVAMSRLRGLSYVLGLGFLLLLSMVLSTAVQLMSRWASHVLEVQSMGSVIAVTNELVLFGVEILLFLGLMRMGSGPKPPMRYLMYGAVMGAALFTLGKQGMAWYLSSAAVVSAYGAAGSLVVVLMWIYFTAAILLFSAATAKACGMENVRFHRPFSTEERAGKMEDVAAQQKALHRLRMEALPDSAGENI